MSTGLFNKTAGSLIRDALRAANIAGIETPIQPGDFAIAQSLFNNILASLQSKQIHIWSQTEAFLPLVAGQQSYTMGTDHIFTDYKYTQIRVAASATATTIELDSTAGMTVGDFIGIEMSNGVRHWTTIATIPDSDTVTITSGVTSSVVVDATVYTYTTKIDQPVRVLSARFAYSPTSDEQPIWTISRQEYFDISTKSSQGSVNQVYYDRQLTNAKLYVWPTATTCNNILRFSFIKPQYIPEDQSENVLMPPEWYNALLYMLAADLGTVNGIDINRQAILEQKAQIYLSEATASDTDLSPIQFTR